MKKKCGILFLSVMVFFVIVAGIPVLSGATPLTMTFDGGGFNCTPNPLLVSYSEHGMEVTSSSHIHICDNNNDGSPDLRNHRGTIHPYTFEYLGGLSFDLFSFDLSARKNWNPGRATFTSSNGGSAIIDAVGTINFTGSAWRGITWLRWDQGINTNFSTRRTNTVMDNLVFAAAPVPEPGTVILFGTGLLALVMWRRSRRRSASGF